MKILGVDFGKKRIGLSISEGFLSQPYSTIKFDSYQKVFEKLKEIVKKEEVELVVVGIPDPDSIGAKDFGDRLSTLLKIKVRFVDETLTSFEAQGLNKSGKYSEDEIAAALILERYLEETKK